MTLVEDNRAKWDREKSYSSSEWEDFAQCEACMTQLHHPLLEECPICLSLLCSLCAREYHGDGICEAPDSLADPPEEAI